MMKKLVTLIAVLFCVVDGWSSFHKSDKEYEHFYKYSARPLKECKNKLSDSLCEKYQEYCYQNQKVMTLCKKTCGDCPAVSPMSCQSSQFGCCWDNVTTSGPNGNDCPPCKDSTPNCKKITDKCIVAHVQRTCPETCGICTNANCYDDADQAQFCPLFKANGFCELDVKLMYSYCRKTCNLCKTDLSKNSVEANIKPQKEAIIDRESVNKNNNDNDVIMEKLQREVEEEIKKKELTENEDKKKEDVQKLNKEADDVLAKLLLEEKTKGEAESLSKKNKSDALKKADVALLELLEKKEVKTPNEALLKELLQKEKQDLNIDDVEKMSVQASVMQENKKDVITQGNQESNDKNKADDALLKLLANKENQKSSKALLNVEDKKYDKVPEKKKIENNADEALWQLLDKAEGKKLTDIANDEKSVGDTNERKKADEALFKLLDENNVAENVKADENKKKEDSDKALLQLLSNQSEKKEKPEAGATNLETSTDKEAEIKRANEEIQKLVDEKKEDPDAALLRLLASETEKVIANGSKKKETTQDEKDEADEALLKLIIKKNTPRS